MEPASEPQFCMRQGPDGNFTVDKLSCARVYHVNLVVRIKQHPSSRGSGAVEAETSMQLDRTRLVLDQGGLLRLENMGAPPPPPPPLLYILLTYCSLRSYA
jgi:hypothetical protein